MVNHPKNFSKSANRALDVLSYLAVVRAPARASEIADALGLARSSADQLLKTMVAGGYLVLSTQDKTYAPSLRLVRFGRWISECYPAEEKLRAIVQEMHDQTGEIVTLTMQNDCYMQIMDVARGDDEDPLLNVGSKVPVLGSAIGSAALTTKSKGEIRKLVARARYQRAMADEIHGIGPLIERLQRCRVTGYASRQTRRPARGRAGAMATDYMSIAMTLPSRQGGASVVLGLAGPAQQVQANEWRIVSLMRATIDRRLAS